MMDFLYTLGENIENFLGTPVAAAIGTVFIIVTSALILYLMRYFENN